MYSVAFVSAVLLALTGHVALWTILFNRLHTIPWPRPRIKVLEKLIEVAVLGGLGGAIVWFALSPETMIRGGAGTLLAQAYAAACVAVLIRTVVVWWDVESKRANPTQLVSNHTRVVDVAREVDRNLLGDNLTKWIGKVPFNQIQQLAIQEKEISIPDLPSGLEGVTISHISDLHYTGQLTVDYFRYLVDQVNAQQPDLIAITGNIVDKPHCIPWIEETLGRLESRSGTYYILGNHDKRVDETELRTTLNDNGLVDVSRSPVVVSVNIACRCFGERGATRATGQ